MINYSLVQSVKVLQGKGVIDKIGTVLLEAGYKKPMLVFDKGVRNTGIIEKIIANLTKENIDYIEFDKVLPDPPAYIVNEGGKICLENKCDSIIGIGGGSSIDTAKGINILRFNEGSILDYATKEMKHCTGLITIPTTAGTGSELSNGAIISDTVNNVKMPLLCYNCMSEYTILDPELTVGMPAQLTLATGLDVLSHATEAYTSVLSNASTDLICEKVMETVVQYLPIVVNDGKNLEAREKMQIAASMGGWMLYNACAHVGHSLAHVLGAKHHIAHGAACAYAYPSMIKFISSTVPEKVKKVGQILGVKFDGNESDNEIGEKTSKAYKTFINKLGLKSIKEYNIENNNLEELVQSIVTEPFVSLTPLKVTESAAEAMLKETLEFN